MSATKVLGDRLFEMAKARAWREWNDISDDDKREVAQVALDVAGLTLLVQLGVDVSREIAHTSAQVANWGFVGASRVQEALKDGAWAVLGIGADLARAAIAKAVGL